MIKRILYLLIILIVLFSISYSLNNYLSGETVLSFSLLKVYLFHAITAFTVYVIVELIADKMTNQAGYAYLTSVFFKISLFVLIFQNSVFAKEKLSKLEEISLVAPLFLFLIAEAIAVSKLLNNK